MRFGHTFGNLDGQRQSLIGRERPARNPRRQRLALGILHLDDGLPIEFLQPVNGADVGMLQRRGRAGFPPEPVPAPL